MYKQGALALCVACCIWIAGCTSIAVIPESGETITNWSLARDYQAQGRYELARQHFLLALASSRTTDSQTTLQREMDALDRMIQAMR
ncbi:MAG: hypothetical protein RR014_03555 [Bilophila sp.]